MWLAYSKDNNEISLGHSDFESKQVNASMNKDVKHTDGEKKKCGAQGKFELGIQIQDKLYRPEG